MSQPGTDQEPSPFASAPASTPPPFGAVGSPPPPPAYTPTVSGFDAAEADAELPPRPAVPVGAAMLVLGGALLLIAPLLTWYSYRGASVIGYDGLDYPVRTNGSWFAIIGVLAVGFGVAQLVARRLVAVSIAAIVAAASGLVLALATIADLDDEASHFKAIEVQFGVGHGPQLAALGCAVALAGGITTLARRRRWPAPVPPAA